MLNQSTCSQETMTKFHNRRNAFNKAVIPLTGRATLEDGPSSEPTLMEYYCEEETLSACPRKHRAAFVEESSDDETRDEEVVQSHIWLSVRRRHSHQLPAYYQTCKTDSKCKRRRNIRIIL